jgi:outer membrane protein TolC
MGSPAWSAELFVEEACANDPGLVELLAQALAKSPDLAGGRLEVQAERQRVSQAGALGDPMVSVGYQNDGFTSLPFGDMPTTYVTLMATQPVTLPGKRDKREAVARFDAPRAEARVSRVRLSLEAEVRRGYIELLLVRDQLALLAEIEALWQQAEGLAKTRYEVGEGSQSDLLRSQLERSRLVQRRWALEADERVRVATLNRLRVANLDEPIVTRAHLSQLGDPPVPTADAARADALARSPELAEAALALEQAKGRVVLAHAEWAPDFSVSAGVMLRGALEPMWQVGFSVPLPIFADRKQSKVVSEADLRRAVGARSVEGVSQVLLLRTYERLNALAATVRANHLYRDGLLVLSKSAASSAMGQYGVGRAPFASVLDVLNGYLGDQASYLESMAQAHRLAITQTELSLASTASVGMGVGAGSVPGSGGGEMAKPAAAAQPAAGGGAAAPSSSGSGM